MGWEEVRSWVLPSIGIVSLLWQVWKALRPDYATKADIVGMATKAEVKECARGGDVADLIRVFNDRFVDAEKETTSAHHRIDLLERDVKGLPGYTTINELKEGMAELTAVVREVKAEVRAIDEKVDIRGATLTRIEQALMRQP